MNLPIIPVIKSVTDLRYQTANIIKLLEQNQPVVVIRDSSTVAVMISPNQYRQIVSLCSEFEDNEATKRLEKAIEKGGDFSDFSAYDRKQRKKLNLP